MKDVNSMVKIKHLSVYAPNQIITNEMIEHRVNSEKEILREGLLEKVFGIKERRFATSDEQVSDLAVKATLPIFEQIDYEEIDFLIFAAACSDLIEPATSVIIQHKLGLKCPAIDIKNACNSFVSAVQIASSLIESNTYKNILIVNGEKLSNAINYDIKDIEQLKNTVSGYTLGDAGAALVLSKSNDSSGILFQRFMSNGAHWELCTIKGGGSLYPHDVSKLYFEGKTAQLKDVLIDEAKEFLKNAFHESGWSPDDVDHIITHQVSTQTFEVICKEVGIDISKNISIFEHFGNIAAASIPMALHQGIHSNTIKKGDKIAIVGLAAGISASLQLMIW